MEFGSHFKELRENRGLSVAEAAQDIVSPQFLRKFEKGNCDTSLTNMMRLLYRINVTWEEFLLYSEAETIDRLIKGTEAFLDTALKTEDEALLLERMMAHKQAFETTHDAKELLLSELCHTILKEFIRNERYVSELIVEKLREVDDWGHFETFVAIYARLPFDSEELILRCEQLLRKDIMESANYYWACDFIIHVIDVFMLQGKYTSAELLLQKYSSSIGPERSIVFAPFDLMARYLEGKLGVALDLSTGAWKSEQVIHVYRDVLGYTMYGERLKVRLEQEYAKKYSQRPV